MFRKLLYSAFGILGEREVKTLEAETHDPRAGQQARLLELLQSNTETVFGREKGFQSIRSISDFQSAVPVNNYEDLSPYIERAAAGEPGILTSEMPFMFATTSGTTGSRKLIPVTRAYVKEFRRASVPSGYTLLKNFPGVTNGVTLSVFSPAEESRTSAGIPCGAISGRLYLEEPKLIKKFVSPLPYELFLIKDYESRYYSLLRCSLVLPISVFYTLNPSTIVVLAKRMGTYGQRLIKDIADGTLNPPAELPSSIRDALHSFLRPNPARANELQKLLDLGRMTPQYAWKNLSLVSCWTKAAASFYLQDMPEFFGDTPISDITYGASEGRGTVGISPTEQMLAIRSHFYEFLPEDEPDGKALLCDEIETGRNYSILFTTAGGLYRYRMNDVLKVVGWHNRTPKLEFLHKTGNISSFTGEKITESQIVTAATHLAATTGIKFNFFTVVPQFRPEPHYDLWCEPADDPQSQHLLSFDDKQLDSFVAKFDDALKAANIEYEAKRESRRLTPPTLHVLKNGTYDSLRKWLVAQGMPDAQVKISHLNPKAEIADYLNGCRLRTESPTRS